MNNYYNRKTKDESNFESNVLKSIDELIKEEIVKKTKEILKDNKNLEEKINSEIKEIYNEKIKEEINKKINKKMENKINEIIDREIENREGVLKDKIMDYINNIRRQTKYRIFFNLKTSIIFFILIFLFGFATAVKIMEDTNQYNEISTLNRDFIILGKESFKKLIKFYKKYYINKYFKKHYFDKVYYKIEYPDIIKVSKIKQNKIKSSRRDYYDLYLLPPGKIKIKDEEYENKDIFLIYKESKKKEVEEICRKIFSSKYKVAIEYSPSEELKKYAEVFGYKSNEIKLWIKLIPNKIKRRRNRKKN